MQRENCMTALAVQYVSLFHCCCQAASNTRARIDLPHLLPPIFVLTCPARKDERHLVHMTVFTSRSTMQQTYICHLTSSPPVQYCNLTFSAMQWMSNSIFQPLWHCQCKDNYLLTQLALSFKDSRWYLVQLCEDNVEAVQSLRDVSGWQKLPVATAQYCHNTCIAPHTKCHTQCHTTWWQCILLLVKISQDGDSQVTTHLLYTALTYNDIFEAGFRQVSSLVKVHTKWLPCSCDICLQFSVYVHLSNLLCLLIYSWCLVVAPAMNGRSNSGEHFWIPRRRFENSFPPVDHIHQEEEPQGDVNTKQMQAHVPQFDRLYIFSHNWELSSFVEVAVSYNLHDVIFWMRRMLCILRTTGLAPGIVNVILNELCEQRVQSQCSEFRDTELDLLCSSPQLSPVEEVGVALQIARILILLELLGYC